jgi:regulatory protein YycH of two-component signal transduction system YycFG
MVKKNIEKKQRKISYNNTFGIDSNEKRKNELLENIENQKFINELYSLRDHETSFFSTFWDCSMCLSRS